MRSAAEQERVNGRSALTAAILPNAAYARFCKLVAGIFLFVGLIALTERVWVLSSDLHARKTWPVADGEIVSAKQLDDSELPGRVRGHTRYWVEYEVRFAVPAEQCRTGIIYEGGGETMPCRGVVQTRHTQSTSEVFQWLLHGYHPSEHVEVLWNPEGTTSTDIKIAGESVWLRYNFGGLIFSVVWVLGFGLVYLLAARQIDFFAGHPQQEREGERRASASSDSEQLTDLDLS